VYDTILVPLDGSEVSESVLPYAIELVRRCRSKKVVLIEVVESLGQAMATMAPSEPAMVTPEATEAIMEGVEAEQQAAREYLSGVAPKFKDAGAEVETVVVSGSPGIEIAQFAESNDIELITISTHGRGGLGRALLGSVADHLLHHVHVPVMVLRYRSH
jgi:nucleotide-binding universal stress UspA family protein